MFPCLRRCIRLAKLKDAGLVSIEKGYVAKTPMTTLSLTKKVEVGLSGTGNDSINCGRQHSSGSPKVSVAEGETL